MIPYKRLFWANLFEDCLNIYEFFEIISSNKHYTLMVTFAMHINSVFL